MLGPESSSSNAAQPPVTFEQYLDRMKPWVERIVHRRAHRHEATLSREDLLQDALHRLWTVYQRHAAERPIDELCRIGTTAVVRKMITRYNRSSFRKIPLKGSTPQEGLNTIGREDPTLVQVHCISLDRITGLGVDGEDALTALILRDAVDRLLQDGLSLESVTAVAMSLAPGQHDATHMRRLVTKLRRIFSQEFGIYSVDNAQQGNNGNHKHQETHMQETKVAGPEAPEDEYMPPAAASSAPTEAPAKKPATKATAKPAKPAKKEKAEKAEKPAKKAAKVKAKGEEKPALKPSQVKVGDEVVYLGGSRASWLKTGAVGKYVRPRGKGKRFQVKFGERSTVLSGKFLKAK